MSLRRQDRDRTDCERHRECDGERDRDRDRCDESNRRNRRRSDRERLVVEDETTKSRHHRQRSRSLQLESRRQPSRSRSLKIELCHSRSRSLRRRRRRQSRSRSLQVERRRRRTRSRSWSEYQRRREASRERHRAEEVLAREKAREAREVERAEKEPSETILVHGIPETGVMEDQIESAAWNLAVQACCSMPDAVHFVYDKSTHEFCGYATVEFPHKEAAKLFKDHANGLIEVEGVKLTLKYHHTCTEPSRSPERPERRRHDDATVTLIVKGLATSTSEAAVIDAFQPFATVKHIRHFPRRGFAFVQFHSVEDCIMALQKFENESRNIIDGQRIVANFAKERDDARLSGTERGFLGKQLESQVALQALAIANAQGDELIAKMEQQQVVQENTEKALTGVNSDMWANYMQSFAQTETVQSTNTFKHDTKSGFYLDDKAGLYYDPNTTYFFTTDYKKYFIYDHEVEMLCHVDAEGKQIPNGERRPLPGKEKTSSDRENRQRGAGGRADQHRHRSRSRRSAHRSQRSLSRQARRSRSCKRNRGNTSTDTKKTRQVASDIGIVNGEFKPIRFAGGDPLACLAPAPAPVVTPKAEAKKKKRPQQDVLGLAPMPNNEDLHKPGRITVMSGAHPGPVQISMPSPPIFESPILKNPMSSVTFATPSVTSSASAIQQPIAVIPGEWICEVCMRKFSCEEMLMKHEQFSDLHKQNLAKLHGDV